MGFKFRIGNLIVISTKGKDDWEAKLDEKVESLETKIERGVEGWIKNDRIFDGFRNTYARVLITLMSWGGLLGFGYFAFVTPGLFWWYAGTMMVLIVMNQLSVRYVFSEERSWIVDEYQARRRDQAYHGAFRRVNNAIGLVVFLLLWNWAFELGGPKFLQFIAKPRFELTIDWSIEQLGVVVVAIIAFLSLVKYLAWGMKGEPWRSKDEPNE